MQIVVETRMSGHKKPQITTLVRMMFYLIKF